MGLLCLPAAAGVCTKVLCCSATSHLAWHGGWRRGLGLCLPAAALACCGACLLLCSPAAAHACDQIVHCSAPASAAQLCNCPARSGQEVLPASRASPAGSLPSQLHWLPAHMADGLPTCTACSRAPPSPPQVSAVEMDVTVLPCPGLSASEDTSYDCANGLDCGAGNFSFAHVRPDAGWCCSCSCCASCCVLQLPDNTTPAACGWPSLRHTATAASNCYNSH